MVVASQLHEASAEDVRGEVATLLDVQLAVTRAVQNERRALDAGQKRADVGIGVHEDDVACTRGTETGASRAA